MHSLSTAFTTFCRFNSYKKHVAWMCASFLLSWREDDFSRGNEWGTLFLLVYRNHFFLRFSSIVRVTWSHALALDCIRDILCIQFVQKTRGVDVRLSYFLDKRMLFFCAFNLDVRIWHLSQKVPWKYETHHSRDLECALKWYTNALKNYKKEVVRAPIIILHRIGRF